MCIQCVLGVPYYFIELSQPLQLGSAERRHLVVIDGQRTLPSGHLPRLSRPGVLPGAALARLYLSLCDVQDFGKQLGSSYSMKSPSSMYDRSLLGINIHDACNVHVSNLVVQHAVICANRVKVSPYPIPFSYYFTAIPAYRLRSV